MSMRGCEIPPPIKFEPIDYEPSEPEPRRCAGCREIIGPWYSNFWWCDFCAEVNRNMQALARITRRSKS
jgi:hypothetical protein